jgi:hypothetical protein
MVAVEFAHDPDDAVDRPEVRVPHRAEGDEQRLIETADLDRCEFRGRRRRAAGDELADDRAHPLFPHTETHRDFRDRNAPVEIIDDPLLPLEFRETRSARVRRGWSEGRRLAALGRRTRVPRRLAGGGQGDFRAIGHGDAFSCWEEQM